MKERTGMVLIWIIIIALNLFVLAGGHGGRGGDYLEEQHYEYR